MSKKILYYDPTDDRVDLTNILAQHNFQVTNVVSTSEVYRLLSDQHFDLLISEILFTGNELEKYLQKTSEICKSSNIPHMSVTATKNVFDISMAETFKVRPILLKPVFPDFLIKTVNFKILNKNKCLLLCSETSRKNIENAFLSMGFEPEVITKLYNFNRLIHEKNFDFVVFDDTFEGVSPIQLLNRLISLSLSRIPLYFFLKNEDVLLNKLLTKYGPYQIQIPPFDFSICEEQIQDLILKSDATILEKDSENKKETAKEESAGMETELITPLKEPELSKSDETISGVLSLSEFMKTLPSIIDNAKVCAHLLHYFKNKGIFHKQKCLDLLQTAEGKSAAGYLAGIFSRGNDALREGIIDLFADFLPNQQIFECLVKGIQDKLPSIQYNALLGLKNYKIQVIAPYIYHLLKSPLVKIRLLAASLLENYKGLNIFKEFLQGALLVDDLNFGKSLIQYLGQNYSDLKDLSVFLPVFQSSHTSLKESLIEFLISRKDKRIFPFLKICAQSNERVLIRMAVEGVKVLNEPSGMEVLIPLLNSKESSMVENTLLELIKNHLSPKYVSIYAFIVEKADDPFREEIIDIVKSLKEKDCAIVLEKALRMGGTGTKLAAMEAMKYWKKENTVLYIGRLLDDQDRVLQDYVYDFLKDNLSPSCIENLIKIFLYLKKDESKETVAHLLGKLVKDSDESSLLKMIQKDSYSQLIKILKSSGVSLGKFTSEVLGNHISKAASFEVLLRTLNDKNVEARAEAAFNLGELKNKEAIPYLMRFIHDENWHVRRLVAEALGKLEAYSASSEIIKLLRDENAGVRYAASEALKKFRLKFKEPLFPMLMQENSVKVLESMTFLIAPFPDQKTADVFLPKLSASNLLTRISAGANLLSLWSDIDRKQIQSWLSSDHWEIRLLAISYIAKEEPFTIMESMDVFILDQSEEIRRFLINFISLHKPNERIEMFSHFADDQSPLVRRQMISSLSKDLSEEGMNFIIQLFEKEKDDSVLETIFKLLEDHRDPRIPGIIEEKYDKFNPNYKKLSDEILQLYRQNEEPETL